MEVNDDDDGNEKKDDIRAKRDVMRNMVVLRLCYSHTDAGQTKKKMKSSGADASCVKKFNAARK